MSRRKSRALALAEPTPIRERTTPKVQPRVGYDGQPQSMGHWDGEYHPDLKLWESRVARLNEARTGDATIVGAVDKIWWAVARGTWTADSQAGDADTDPATLLVRANLLRSGAPELGVYRMRTKWRQFLWECFTAEVFGVSVFEKVERVQPGPLGTLKVIHHMAWMHPSSIWQFRVDRDGFLLGVVQRFQARWWDPSKGGKDKSGAEQSDWFEDFIPADQLFVRTRKQEGSDVEGTSMLRGMYGDAKRNQNIRNWQAIHAQRVAVGIPRVKLLPEAPPEIQQRAIDMAKSMRGGAQDRLYVVETPGVEVGWVDNGTGAFDTAPMLRAGEDRLRGVLSLEWAGLGLSGAGGARAVGDVQQRPFWSMCEGIADAIAEDIQTDIVEPLTRANWGGASPPAVIRVADVSPVDIPAIAEAATAGLIVVTAEDSNAIRRSLKMRTLRPDEMAAHDAALVKAREPKPQERQPAPRDEPAPEKPQDKPRPPADDEAEELAERRRVELAAKSPKTHPRVPPSEFEVAHCDLKGLDCHEDLAREAAIALRRIREDAVAELLKGARIDGMTVTLGKSTRAAKAMRAALLEIADKAREIGRESMRHEVRSQVATLAPAEKGAASLMDRVRTLFGLADPPPPLDPFAGVTSGVRVKGVRKIVDLINDEMLTVVTLNVESILDGLGRSLKRGIVDALAAEATDADAIAEATRRVLDSSEASLEQAGREMASRGINGGRAEVAEQAIEDLPDEGLAVEVATRTSVLEKGSTCDECWALHGTKVDVGSDEYFALMPPARCEGFSYCRCLYTFAVQKAKS